MSSRDQNIVCRRCKETIRTDVGSCPHCGAKIRSRKVPTIMLVFGLAMMVVTPTDFGSLWLFGLIGLVIAFGGGYFLYDQRQRRQATESRSSEG